jgi:uncharacterized membrane protein (DUF106 family)
MKKKNPEKPQSNAFVTGLINMFFDIIKHFVKDMESVRKVNKIDKFTEQFSTLEHLVLKLESKIEENRRHIEDLKNRLLWGNITIIALIIINIFLILNLK